MGEHRAYLQHHPQWKGGGGEHNVHACNTTLSGREGVGGTTCTLATQPSVEGRGWGEQRAHLQYHPQWKGGGGEHNMHTCNTTLSGRGVGNTTCTLATPPAVEEGWWWWGKHNVHTCNTILSGGVLG